MSFMLIVTEGSDKGKAFELHDEVIRVGSAPDMMIQIAGTPDHAFTIMRNEQWHDVINRGCETLKVNGRPVMPGKALKWRPGRAVEIDGKTELILQRAAAVQVPSTLSVPDEIAIEVKDRSRRTSPGSKSTKILLNTLVVVVAIGVIFELMPSRHSPEHEFYEKIVDCAANPQYVRPDDFELKSVIRKLRLARLDDVRLNKRLALSRYRQLKSALDRHVAEQVRKQTITNGRTADAPTFEELILDFVNRRIEVLG